MLSRLGKIPSPRRAAPSLKANISRLSETESLKTPILLAWARYRAQKCQSFLVTSLRRAGPCLSETKSLNTKPRSPGRAARPKPDVRFCNSRLDEKDSLGRYLQSSLTVTHTLMNDAVRKVTLEDMMKMMTEMMKMNQTDQKEMNECRHTKLAESDEEIKDSHTNISTDGYVDDALCEYKVVPVDEDMSTNDHFQEQSCENNTMEEPSAVEEPTVFEDAAEASTIATDLVNDEAAESTTPGENFCSEDEIMRITDDPVSHTTTAALRRKTRTIHGLHSSVISSRTSMPPAFFATVHASTINNFASPTSRSYDHRASTHPTAAPIYNHSCSLRRRRGRITHMAATTPSDAFRHSRTHYSHG
ncbi:hypothetical protein DEO72_LG6g1258 [Vigna unguiculata]|uniref:Uncharacterized protein n=1 Tax=Vigna unguiculata TaxID=3917 RepID=A0A4D6M5H9_VIGUN|nr:hypothetical protein DEO72_LG6g1258 [Vigna unguiculata]